VAWPDADFPADPYPGAVPPGSFAHLDEVAHPVRPGRELDAWLAARGAPPAEARVPVLAYGSNRCPSKITWLRRQLGLGPDPVVVLRATTTGVAAVWAAGLRLRDGQRPAVLAAAPDLVEEHAIWLATPEQVAVLDRCEGRDDRFRLARLHTGEVRTEDGARIEDPWVYLGHAPTRHPLLIDGHPVRCADVPQEAARDLLGDRPDGIDAAAARIRPSPDPGDGLDATTGVHPSNDPSDGLDATTVIGTPSPDEWPPALFAYGLLRPGQPSWSLVAPHAAGEPRPATVPGTVLDTGRGYPAWLPAGPGNTSGVVIPLRDPATLLPTLDAYEGPEYRRIRVTVPADGTVCWAYAWQVARA
jgi:gamma-glutamylcyclotransferase (GGCT)/AIG2-like uncharacterized protein YtfP